MLSGGAGVRPRPSPSEQPSKRGRWEVSSPLGVSLAGCSSALVLPGLLLGPSWRRARGAEAVLGRGTKRNPLAGGNELVGWLGHPGEAPSGAVLGALG